MNHIPPRRSATSHDAEQLSSLLEGTKAVVLLPDDAAYAKSIERWSSAASKSAGVVVVPATTEDVSIAIKYASEQNLEVAVHGGGHSTAGASSTQGGLLIDLHGGLRDVHVDPESKQIRVQGGCIWRDVNDAAWKHKLAVVGGGVDDTGVGGLTLGGGYGNLSPSQGLVIDALIEATVVLASGEIVKASEKENADLFWALRGAGQNFGVVTDFVFQAQDQDDAYIGTMIIPPTEENIQAVVNWSNAMYTVKHTADGPKTHEGGRMFTLLILIKIPPISDKAIILLIHMFNGNEADGKELLKPLFDLNLIHQDMGMKEYPMANRLAPTEKGRRVSQKGVAFKIPIRADFVKEQLDELNNFISKYDDAANTGFAWELFNPAKVVASDRGCFANRGWALNGLIMPQWTKAENDDVCRQFARDITEQWKKELERAGETTSSGIEGGAAVRGAKGAVMLYGNYDQYDEKSKDIFGENYPRLQQIKGRYDAKNMFNKLFPIQPTF